MVILSYPTPILVGMIPLRARAHYRLGGLLCRIRGAHRLSLVVAHTFVPGTGERSERRPLCKVCWQMPGD